MDARGVCAGIRRFKSAICACNSAILFAAAAGFSS